MFNEYTLDETSKDKFDVRWSGNFERTIGSIQATNQGNRHTAFVNDNAIGDYSSKDGALCAVIADFERAQ